MTDLLQAHTDHARHARQAEHREALRPIQRSTARMAAYIAGLPNLAERRLALAAARELAPDLAGAIEREVRNLFALERQRRRIT